MEFSTFPRLHWIDLSIIVLFLVVNSIVGFFVFRKHKPKSDAEDFILAGRSLTLPAFVATLVTMWYGGVLGVGEYSYDKGIVMWVVFGIPYYASALIFAFVLARRVNSDRGNSTIADRLRSTYGEKAGYLGAGIVFFITSPAGYIMTLGTLYQWFFGIDTVWGMLIAVITPVAYLLLGGLRAPVSADKLRFLAMFLGFAVILPFAYQRFGGVAFITSHVPATHLKPAGGLSPWYIAVWYIIALSTLVDPNVNTRVFAAHTPRIAKQGLILSVLCWLVFDLMTNVAGLYARAAFATLPASRFAYPALAQAVLPIGLQGLFYVGLLSSELSAVDAFTFTSATIVGHDILWRLFGKGDTTRVKHYTRYGLVVTAIVSLAIILVTPKIYIIWYALGSILVPAILFPLTFSYFKSLRPSNLAAILSMIAGVTGSLAIYIIGIARGTMVNPIYLWGMEPIYAGLILSFGVLLAERCLRIIYDQARGSN
jgi:SSS family solute:Na+ symporter